MRFDDIANPERTIGRFALFDVLVQIGDRSTALSKGASWTLYWRKASLHRPTDSSLPVVRLIRSMMALDEPAARKAICDVQREEFGTASAGARSPLPDCDIELDVETESAPANTGMSSVETRDVGHRRRR